MLTRKENRMHQKGNLTSTRGAGALARAEAPASAAQPKSNTSGLDTLRTAILARIPEGPAHYPEDHITDQPERFMAAELIREQILRETRQEVPHSVAVVIEEFQEKKTLTRISAIIYVEREGQKAIIIGSKAAMLKRIGTLSRHKIETLLDRKVFLELNVKVRSNWRDNPEFLNELDWRTMNMNQPE